MHCAAAVAPSQYRSDANESKPIIIHALPTTTRHACARVATSLPSVSRSAAYIRRRTYRATCTTRATIRRGLRRIISDRRSSMYAVYRNRGRHSTHLHTVSLGDRVVHLRAWAAVAVLPDVTRSFPLVQVTGLRSSPGSVSQSGSLRLLLTQPIWCHPCAPLCTS